MRKLRVLIVLMLCLCLLLAAGIFVRNIGLADRDIARLRPDESALVGVWFLVPSSYPSVTRRTGETLVLSQMELRADGSFAARGFPVEDVFRYPRWYIREGQGRWELELQQKWVVVLVFADGFGFTLEIGKDDRNLELYYRVEGPDSEELWKWHRGRAEFGDRNSVTGIKLGDRPPERIR